MLTYVVVGAASGFGKHSWNCVLSILQCKKSLPGFDHIYWRPTCNINWSYYTIPLVCSDSLTVSCLVVIFLYTLYYTCAFISVVICCAVTQHIAVSTANICLLNVCFRPSHTWRSQFVPTFMSTLWVTWWVILYSYYIKVLTLILLNIKCYWMLNIVW